MEIMVRRFTAKEIILKLFFLLNIFISLICLAFDLTELVSFEAFLVVFDSLFLFFISKSNVFMAYIFSVIAFSNYSICYTNYISPNQNTIFTGLTDTYAGFLGLQIILLFISFVGLFFNFRIDNTYDLEFLNNKVVQNRRFWLYHFANILLLLLILLFAYTRPDSLGDRGSPSTIYEYSILLITVGYYFSKRNRLVQVGYIFMVFLFSLQNFIFGGRITGLQLLFILLIFFFGNKRISLKVILSLMILYIFMASIGKLRGEILSLNFNSIMETLSILFDNGFSLDTAYSSYYTSLQFILTSELISFGQRLYMGALQFISFIIGGSLLPEANIAAFVSNYYFNYMGGVLPFFGYFCFSWMGILLYAFLVAFYLNLFGILPQKVNLTSQHGFIMCCAIYIAATTFRWYLYSPNNLIRGVFLLSIVYYGSRKFLAFTTHSE